MEPNFSTSTTILQWRWAATSDVQNVRVEPTRKALHARYGLEYSLVFISDTSKHIYWVGDQIMSTISDDLDGQTLHLSPDGATVEDIKPADILEHKGLGIVAEGLDWSFRDEEVPEDDEELRDSLLTMFSVFEPEDALPGEFRCPESPLTSERSKVYRQVADLFTQACAQDPGLYIKTRKLIDANFQHRVFFEKIENRIIQTFKGLDAYCANSTPGASPGAQRFDVKTCAKKLTSLVRNIDEYYQKQDEDDPETRNIAIRAAAALVTILDRVSDRNVNAYENMDMETPSDPFLNNLFVALIGTSTDESPVFVLDALSVLPQEDVHRNHWETLQTIEERLSSAAETPSSYLQAFRRVVYESRKRRASEVRESDPKRTMQE